MKRPKAEPMQSRGVKTIGVDSARDLDPTRSSNKLHEVQIEKPVYGGAFLARIEGKAVFVPLVLPGERARINIVDDKRGYSMAESTGIVAPAPERMAPLCRHFGVCGGCNYQHATYQAQLNFKQAILRETLDRGGVRPPDEIAVLSAEPWGYRNRIRLALDAEGNPGYRGRRSHEIVPIAECPIAAPLLVHAALAFAEIAHRIPDNLRPAEISLFCDSEQTALLAGIHTLRPAELPFDRICSRWAEAVPELKGAEFTSQERAGRSLQTLARWGGSSLNYRAAGFSYRVGLGAFFQVNLRLVDALVDSVTADYSGSLAWDLFAGAGLFACQLATRFEDVVAVESAPSATPSLIQNLTGLSARASQASTLDFLGRTPSSERPDLIVVDPPRTGLGAEVTTLLARFAAPALVYVSCDPATLARDLRSLIAAGYTIEHLALADLFPQTYHLETVVRLRRA
jgi:23S rRNA (uracil1939-C5)-methyltransferase